MLRDGETRGYVARVAEGAERDRLWLAVNDLYAGYDDYQRRTHGRDDSRGGSRARGVCGGADRIVFEPVFG